MKYTQTQLSALFQTGIHKQIAFSILRKMESIGNYKEVSFDELTGEGNSKTAREIMFNYNKPYSKEDLENDIALAILEENEKGELVIYENTDFTPTLYDMSLQETIPNDGKQESTTAVIRGEFNDGLKAIYKAGFNALYNNATRVDNKFRRLYIEIDGETVAITDIKELSAHCDYNEIEFMSEYQTFCFWVASQKKSSFCDDMETVVKYLSQGFKWDEIVNNTTMDKARVKYVIKTMRELWKEFHKN